MPLTIDQVKIVLADFVLSCREKELENAALREALGKLAEEKKASEKTD
jgi:hypothetical protein